MARDVVVGEVNKGYSFKEKRVYLDSYGSQLKVILRKLDLF